MREKLLIWLLERAEAEPGFSRASTPHVNVLDFIEKTSADKDEVRSLLVSLRREGLVEPGPLHQYHRGAPRELYETDKSLIAALTAQGWDEAVRLRNTAK